MSHAVKLKFGNLSLLIASGILVLNCAAFGQDAPKGVHSLDIEVIKLFGQTLQVNYQHEFISNRTLSVGPRFTGLGKYTQTGQGWGLELQYLQGDKDRKSVKIKNYDKYMRNNFEWHWGIYLNGDRWKKEIIYIETELITTTSFSTGGLLNFRIYLSDNYFIDFYAGLGYRFSKQNTDEDYYEYGNHLFRPGYTGIMIKTGIKTGFRFH